MSLAEQNRCPQINYLRDEKSRVLLREVDEFGVLVGGDYEKSRKKLLVGEILLAAAPKAVTVAEAQRRSDWLVRAQRGSTISRWPPRRWQTSNHVLLAPLKRVHPSNHIATTPLGSNKNFV